MEKKKKVVKFTNDEKLAIRGVVADKNYNPDSKVTKKAERIAKDKSDGKQPDKRDVIPLAIKALLDDGTKLPENVKQFFVKNKIDIKKLRENLAAYSIVAAFRLMNNVKRPDLSGIDYLARITGEIAPEKKIFGVGITPDMADELENEIKNAIKK